jgi:2-dehydropantoate 2-reductase
LKDSRILIFGAGAIGLWLAGLLTRAGSAVTVITRQDHYEKIRTSGLTISKNGNRQVISGITVYPNLASVPPSEIDTLDWVFLTVKAYDVAGALEDIKTHLKSDFALVSFQNGIGIEDFIAQEVCKDKLFFASVTQSVAIIEPGHLMLAPKGGIGLAAYLKPNPSLKPLSQLLSHAGIKIRTYGNFREMRWSKLLLNILGNATSAILDYPTDEIFKRKALFAFELEALREGLKVITKLRLTWQELPGFNLPPFKEILLWLPSGLLFSLWRKKLIRGRGEKSPSLRLEMTKGRAKSEIEFLNGAIVKWGFKTRIKTPANEFLCRTLLGILSGKVNRDLYWHHPEKLIWDYREFKRKGKPSP